MNGDVDTPLAKWSHFGSVFFFFSAYGEVTELSPSKQKQKKIKIFSFQIWTKAVF